MKKKKSKELKEKIDTNRIEIQKDDSGTYEINIDYCFKTKADITDRTITIAEAFGLGLDEDKTFTVYDNFNMHIKTGDIIYITGDSGGGKSCLLKIFDNNLSKVISMDDLEIDNDEVVIEGLGKDVGDALYKLNMAGLCDSFLYLRKYSQLSDGQKYRYKIAKFIDQEDKDVWLMDEFCATLDRTTAKILSYNLQRLARKLNKTVIVCTTHTDLLNELRPTIYLEKGYESDANVTYYEYDFWKGKKLDMYDNIKIEVGSRKDYEKLKKYHYRQESLPPLKAIYKMTYLDELIGVMVIAWPRLNIKGRNIFTNNKYAKMTKENCQKINSDFDYIARVIIAPKYRGIGLSSHFVKEYIEKYAETKYIESLSVMSNYHPFFEHGGLRRIDVPEDEKRNAMVAQLNKYGFNTDLLSSSRYCQEVFEKLNHEDQLKVKEMVRAILNKYKGAIYKMKGKSVDEVTEKDLYAIMKELKRAKTVYLIKEINPK